MVVKSWKKNEENLPIKKYLKVLLTNKTTCKWAACNTKKVFLNMFLFIYQQRVSLFTILCLEIFNSLVLRKKYFETAYEAANSFILLDLISWNSPPELFLGKGLLKRCSKFTWEHPCRSVISVKLQRVFSCKFAAYFQNIFSWEHLWRAAD